MALSDSVKKIENVLTDEVRVIFLKSHELVVGGAKLPHQVGKYYHILKADAEGLIAAGIARLDTVHEELLQKEAEDRAAAAAPLKTDVVEKKPDVQTFASPAEFTSPAPGVAEAGEGDK